MQVMFSKKSILMLLVVYYTHLSPLIVNTNNLPDMKVWHWTTTSPHIGTHIFVFINVDQP